MNEIQPLVALPTEAGVYEVVLQAENGEQRVWTYRFDPVTVEWRDCKEDYQKQYRLCGQGHTLKQYCGNWSREIEMQVVRWKPYVAVYADHSTGALYQMEGNLEKIAKREAVLRVNRAFIEKHAAVLDGLSWNVGYLDPEIELGAKWYRGVPVGAEGIARLWPDVKWRREKPKYSMDEDKHRDWVGELDGVKLRIEKAEVFRPVYIPEDGPVNLERGEHQ